MTTEQLPASFAREQRLIRLLMVYIATGLVFMLLPGTFLGVWNLFTISAAQSETSVSAAWIQAHGHAQLFGWIGTFMLGIGFYSIPNLRKVSSFSFTEGWLCWLLWTTGVSVRWLVNVYQWSWTTLLPLSAMLELGAVLLFSARFFQGHKLEGTLKKRLEPWALLVIFGTAGFLLTLIVNLVECLNLSQHATNPAFSVGFDKFFLALSIWGFAVPIAWGFTARWMPVFLGLRPTRRQLLFFSPALNSLGIILLFNHHQLLSAIALFAGSASVVVALRLFERTERPAKTSGVHPSFPVFIRLAYVWLLTASCLEVWAAAQQPATGITGASRHAITVGFLAIMVFTVAPRMLPAFLGRKRLYSESLMCLALSILCTGCSLRVFSEIVAYQELAKWAWPILPISATLELIAVSIFAINMGATLHQPPLMPQMDAVQ